MVGEHAANSPSGITLHLVLESVWLAQAGEGEYHPEGFAEEGYIHCTDGNELLIEVANRYYRDDSRAFLVLEVDLDCVKPPVIYEDAEQVYPHVYGPIERDCVVRVRRVERAADGTFIAIGDAVP